MIINNAKIKKLPIDTKFSIFSSYEEDIILAEYLIAILLYNGFTLDQILESTNEIKTKREDTQLIMTQMILDSINLNPEYIYL